MVRKTREQVWSELEAIGEDEVRARLAAHPPVAEDAGLISEWLAQKERIATALAATSREVEERETPWVRRIPGYVGQVALVGVAAVALGLLLIRRKR